MARTEVLPPPRPGVQRLHYEFGPVHIAPGQNTIEFEGNALKPDVPGHIVRFKPNLEYADGTIPRVDVIHLHHGVWLVQLRAAVRRRRGEDDRPAARRLRLAVRPERQVGDEPHDPQPHADADGRLHHLRPRLHPRRDARPTRTSRTSPRSGSTWSAASTRSSTSTRAPAAPIAATRTPTRRRRASAGAAAGPSSRTACSSATAGHLHPGGLWTDLKLTRGGPHGAGVPLEREVLRAGRRGLVGRGDDGDAAELARRRAQGRRAVDLGHLRHAALVLVRVDGDHARRVRRRRQRPRPVRHERRRARRGHARAPRREPQPRRRLRRPARPAAAALRAARALAHRAGQRLRLRPGRPRPHGPQGAPADDPPGPVAALRQPRREARHLPHDHELPRALQRRDGDRLPARRTARCGSTRATSASGRRARRRPPSGSRGGRRRSSAPARTRTSAACTRSCAARSASRASAASAATHRSSSRSFSAEARRSVAAGRAAPAARGGRRPTRCRA